MLLINFSRLVWKFYFDTEFKHVSVTSDCLNPGNTKGEGGQFDPSVWFFQIFSDTH